MTTYCDGSLVKWLIVSVLICQVSSLPKITKDDNFLNEISESKRDIASAGGFATVPLIKSPIFNPYMFYPPGKPLIYPFLTPSDILLSRLAKSTSTSSATSTPAKSTPLDGADPSLMGAYFKAKKDDFLAKLYERLANATTSDISARSTPVADDPSLDTTKPPLIDSSYFLKKKYEFLETLFKTLNATAASPTNATETENTTTAATTTPKPTIVPPDFWFPFAKLPKPTKAPKPTKPPKAKKILKDALDTILLQSLLIDMGVDPKDATLSKRASAVAAMPKKSKSKKVKSEEDSEMYIPAQVDPALFSAKATDCLNKLFKILNKTESEDLEKYVTPKSTAIPSNIWSQPSETEYVSKLDAFLDLLIKSLNTTDSEPETFEKFKKSKSKPGKKIVKRSTFLDELLHRVTTPPPTTTTTPEPTTTTTESVDIILDSDCDFSDIYAKCCCCGKKCPVTPVEDLGTIIKNCCCCGKKCSVTTPEELGSLLKNCCCCGKNCSDDSEGSGKSSRSLIFKPFGSGFWIPQYLYAAKMGMYLDKLMDTINTAAVNEVESDSSDVFKRSLPSGDADDVSGLPSKEAAISLIISELTELKNDLVDAFADGIKAQKDATPTQKPFNPAAKSFKKPFWGPKAVPTTDPVAPIQKRIDILNDVFDKLTTVEKTLVLADEPQYDPKLIASLTEILKENSTVSGKTTKYSKVKSKTTLPSPDSPEYYLSKTREFLKTMYDKMDDSK